MLTYHTYLKGFQVKTQLIFKIQGVSAGRQKFWRYGVLEPRGKQMGQDLDEIVIAPVATVMQIFNRSSLFRILIEINAHSDTDRIQKQVISLISDRHDEEDITCITQEAVLDSLGGILQALTMAVSGIGAISLAVAGIGIMNVMLVSVSERRSEVGLMKALGARQRQILAVFLVLILTLPWSINQMTGFAESMFNRIANM